ncbi:MAG: dynamin family protein [Candidatus Sumerlaeaceae bacterium]|nr:dynamin family protein [Candidatus Sumerlaeaceae bacterium]
MITSPMAVFQGHAEDDLCSHLQKLEALLDDQNDRQLCRTLAERWHARTFHLAVLGQFKRGKSTLVNALLGRQLLPAAVLPLTAIPTFIRRGEPERLVVHFADGRSEQHPLEAIDQFVTEEKNPENRLHAERVEAFIQSPFLQPGVCIIDTPGIGSVLKHNTAATVNMLSHCDAALFVISPDPPITETEEAFLRTVASIIPRIIPVLAKADIVSPRELEQLREYNTKLLQESLEDDVHLYAVAAARVLHRPPDEIVCDDGYEFARLRRDLARFLSEDKEKLLRRSLTIRALILAREQMNMLRLQLEALRLDTQTRKERLERFLLEAARLRREQEIAIDVLNADGARLIMTVNRAAPKIAESICHEASAELARLIAGVSHTKEIRHGFPSVKQAMTHFIEWVFTRERARLEKDVRKRVTEIAAEHMTRSSDLVQRLIHAAGDIFSLELATTAAISEKELHLEDYWPVLPPPVMLGTITLGALGPILPLAWLRSYHLRRINAAVEESVRINTERLRFGLASGIEATLAGIRDELRRHYDELVRRVQVSVESATEMEKHGEQSRRMREEELLQRLEKLAELENRLERWANGEA